MSSTIRLENSEHVSSSSTMQSLPRELLLDLIAIIGSQSFIDLHKMKVCCKDFLEVAQESYVLQKISLENFPFIEWTRTPNENALLFFKQCVESENSESLYRDGLLKYFNYPDGNIVGLLSLKIAAQTGHKEAMYVYGMILLCSEDQESRKQGVEYMRSLRKSKCIMSLRMKVQSLTNSLWKNNGMLVRNQTPICNSKRTCYGWRVKEGRWSLLDDEDDDIKLCENCRWDYELIRVLL
ncbi:F-box protein At2g35280-like [Vicia villosa]|uniref:F-box protein At2g35280-like n=1 Tax=Vicia villosa TaxID=3911 RepID=UPI00273A994F|nr:F-box protein At2g35280-like [Vicia villosa]